MRDYGRAVQVIGYILLVALVGGGSLVAYLRQWAARERTLNAPSELVTLKAMLARGISNAPGLFAQGHAKAVPQLSELGAQMALVIEYANETDTSPTATAYLRVERTKSSHSQAAYASYFPGGELSFFEVKRKDDLFLNEHEALVAGRQHEGLDRLRAALLAHLRSLRLA